MMKNRKNKNLEFYNKDFIGEGIEKVKILRFCGF